MNWSRNLLILKLTLISMYLIAFHIKDSFEEKCERNSKENDKEIFQAEFFFDCIKLQYQYY